MPKKPKNKAPKNKDTKKTENTGGKTLMSTLQTWSKKVIKELIKHADRDGCYNCKQLIAEMAAAAGIKPEDFKKLNN